MEEFALVTWLNCNPLYEPNTKNTDDGERISYEFLDGNCVIITKQLREKFVNVDSDDNMKNLPCYTL